MLALAYCKSAKLICQYYDYLYNITCIEDEFKDDPEEVARRKAEVPFPAGALQETVVRLLGTLSFMVQFSFFLPF